MIEIKLYLSILLYVVDDNILDGRLQSLKKYTETLVVTSKEIWFDVNADKINYIVMLRFQDAGKSHNI